MDPLDLVNLTQLMQRTGGRPGIKVGLIDGPVLMTHPELASEHIQEVPGRLAGACARASSAACTHGTFVAGVLAARRGSSAPAICPDCTLLVRSIFAETEAADSDMPSATPEELAAAIFESIEAGARLVNLSAALTSASSKGERELGQALDHAARRGVIAVAAAGNQGTVGSSAITRHPWVVPVAACDSRGRPIGQSNFGRSIGRRGLLAPGENISSLGPDGRPRAFGGTSAATPFVTGAIALLWSEFPAAAASEVKFAVTQVQTTRRSTVVPPLLNAWAAYEILARRN